MLTRIFGVALIAAAILLTLAAWTVAKLLQHAPGIALALFIVLLLTWARIYWMGYC